MNALRQLFYFWNSHGTKALGSVSAFLASAQTAVLVMNPQPLSPTHLAWLAAANAFFGAWTVKRGYYNTTQQSPQS